MREPGLFPEWSWVLAFFIGASMGSFLNMLIYRLPRRLSFSNPPKSFCPKCKHSLHLVDLFPLISWLSTGGKCRYCKSPIAKRYFFVELLTAGLFAGLWWQYLVVGYEPVRMIFYMLATAALVAIIYIDWELYIIPDEINAFLLLLGLVMNVILHDVPTALWGALAGWGILWGIALLGRLLFSKDSMGHGDIKMMRGVGALIGPVLLLANMAIAVIAGLVIGVAMMALVKRKTAIHEPQEYSLEEAEEFLVGLNLTELQRSKFEAACKASAFEIAEVGTRAKQAKVGSYQELMAFVGPESIVSLLKFGLFYLLCLDILGIFWHGAYGLIGEKYIDENIEDDTWEPTLTTIPFGPYLAVGALVCMLFAVPVKNALADYWRNTTSAGLESLESEPQFHAGYAFGPTFSRNIVDWRSKDRLTNWSAGKEICWSDGMLECWDQSGAVPWPSLIAVNVRCAGREQVRSAPAHRNSNPPALQNWNKTDRILVQPSGESGAYCA